MDSISSPKNKLQELLNGKPVVWWILIGITFLYSVYFNAKTLINHDVAWYIYGAERLLAGAKLYRDIIEVNPPLNFYLTIIPVSIAKILGLQPTAIYKCFIFFIGWGSLLICFNMLKKIYGKAASSLYWFLTFILSLIFFAYPLFHFAQREHLMIMLCMPYILSSILFIQQRELSTKIRILTVCMAFIGFALKPFFLLSWLTTECFIAINTKSLKILFKRLENYFITGGMILYYISLNIFWPDYFIITKMALQVYDSYNTPLLIILLFRYTYILALIFAYFAFFMVKKIKENLLTTLLILQMTALITVGFIQHKGWPYHFLPYWSITIFFWCCYIASVAIKNNQLKKIINWGPEGVMLIIAVYCVIFRVAVPIHDYEPSYKQYIAQRLINVINKNIFPKSLFVFSTSVDPGFPAAVYCNAKWGSRFNCLWLLPGNYPEDTDVIKYHSETQMNKIEKYVFKATISDLLKTQPELLVFETRDMKQGFAGRKFDFFEYFVQNEKFRDLMSHYHLIHHLDDYALFLKN